MEKKDEHNWTLVTNGKKKIILASDDSSSEGEPTPPPAEEESPSEKIAEPCWFYNNGGCRHKDGSEKCAKECKYLHIYSENVRRPPHLSTRKPCDKYNLEGECRWYNNCKYSHRNLTTEEWSKFYPGIPYTLRTNVQKRQQIENKLLEMEAKIQILEFKQNGISCDVQRIGQNLHQLLRD